MDRQVLPSFDAEWQAIGPFPSGMREHPLYGSSLHAFSSRSDLDPDVDFARRDYNLTDAWPSELPTGGRVGWSTFHMKDGELDVSYPEVNWKQLRSDHGWASLQYQVLLRTRFHLPSNGTSEDLVGFKIDFQQCVEFAFVPVEGNASPVEWYQGDIYGFGGTPSGSTNAGSTSNFVRSLALKAGEYVLLVRAIYEIRLFGDPGENAPTINLKMKIEQDDEKVQLLEGLAQVSSVVDGWLVGSWTAVAVSVPAIGDDIEVHAKGEIEGLVVESRGATRIAAGQTRMVAMRTTQSQAIKTDHPTVQVDLNITHVSTGRSSSIKWDVPLDHKSNGEVFKITFASPSNPSNGPPALVSYAMVVPPSRDEVSAPNPNLPVTLLLHGAGVWPENELFTSNVPKDGAWTVCPMGRSEWGEDWRGGSMVDAWAARTAFGELMRSKLKREVSEETLLVGHSNGGQGAWHSAARYPDRIVGLVVAAGYTKTQDYVPYTQSVSNHYADPAIMGILHAALTPYNNDLHLSNLVHTPIVAVHGSADTNVTPRHSRLQASIVDSWAGKSDLVKIVEVEGGDHWWPGMFEEAAIKDLVQTVHGGSRKTWKEKREEGFTLTCGNPDECGGLAGIRITELIVPGRLARLDVNKQPRKTGDPNLRMRSTNVKRIEVVPLPSPSDPQAVALDNQSLVGRPGNLDVPEAYTLTSAGWTYESETQVAAPTRSYGPVLHILASCGPIVIVPGRSPRYISIAKRVAYDLFVFHRIDVEIVQPDEAFKRVKQGTFGNGNTIVLGGPTENAFAQYVSEKEERHGPLDLTREGTIGLHGRTIKDHGAGLIALQPHPTNPQGLMLQVHGNDDLGLELAARLIPLRTGVPIPDWAIVSPRVQWQGAGGFIGAGFWDGERGWSEGMSWIDRIPDAPTT